MVENDRILAERLNRILMSIALEKPDRVPLENVQAMVLAALDS